MFVDLHQHLVHGMDDGASSFEETAQMLRAAHRDGIRHIFATPHIHPGREVFPFARYRENLQMARDFLKRERIPMGLYSGSEVLYTEETARLLGEGHVPTLGGTPFLLVEFPTAVSMNRMLAAGRRLNNAGYIPIYAHIERYGCLRTVRDVQKLKSLPDVRLQVNAETPLRKHGVFRSLFLNSLFREDLVDYVATDAHDMRSRPINMQASFQVLVEKYGKPRAENLTSRNQAEILERMRQGGQ
ncbi:MAG: hypothetical protein GX647_12655 [Clostridiales bacterium]|jgi:protein-tyrosine phosphatase|nr:hypothetical protein [Clostridiales bacterium]